MVYGTVEILFDSEITEHLCKKELAYEDSHLLEWKPV
jgi:hypothetical protein